MPRWRPDSRWSSNRLFIGGCFPAIRQRPGASASSGIPNLKSEEEAEDLVRLFETALKGGGGGR